jgi:tetratricopeptide (TPR) repeat protein
MQPVARVVATALESGAAAALNEAALSAPLAEGRRSVLEGAGGMLTQLRHYALAAELMAAAAADGAAAERAARLREMKRREELNPPPDPGGMVTRFLLALAADTQGEPDLSSLADFPAHARAAAVRAQRRLFGRPWRPWTGKGPPPGVLLDAAVSTLRLSTEGDTARAVRVRGSVAGGPGSAFTGVWFLAHRPQGLRIVATRETVGLIGHEVLKRVAAGDVAGARQWLDWAAEEQAGTADDVVAGRLLPAFWARGQAGTLEEARLAAAVLLAERGDVTPAAEILSEAAGKATPERRIVIEGALARAHWEAGNAEALLPLAERLAAARPQSAGVFRARQSALRRLKRWDELRQRAEERLRAVPDDPSALRTLAQAGEGSGDVEAAVRAYRTLVERGTAEAMDLNNLAWDSLVLGRGGDEALGHARKSVERSSRRDHTSLHTLAALLADSGRTDEALRTLWEAVERSPDGEPSEEDWWVVGRIAEHLGLPDAARAAYQKVQPEPDERPVSTSVLARRRLAGLGS